MKIALTIFLTILGAVLGSFACCQADRHFKPTKSHRSICRKCKYQLKWYDNIPIFSWIFLKGRCRKCHKKIGPAEILSELFLGFAFLALSLKFLPTSFETVSVWSLISFISLLIFFTILTALAGADAKFGEMPLLWLLALLFFSLPVLTGNIFSPFFTRSFRLFGELPFALESSLLSLLLLPALYFALYKISRGAWVGAGDPLLALSLALASPSWFASLITLFLANFLGSVFGLVGKQKKLRFAPFLAVAFLVSLLLSDLFFL